MHAKPWVYIAGPYRRPNCAINASRAICVGHELRSMLGVVVIVPHLSILEDMICPEDDQYWLDVTMDMMRGCDAVFRMPGESEGSDAEVAEATRLGIPVFTHRAALAEWTQNWSSDGKQNSR
jgi:hypothetical protein